MNLPKLLAGPILRRIEPNQAFIWIAMSGPYHIDAELFEVSYTSFKYKYDYIPVPIRTETTSIRLGKKLYGYLVKIIPKNGVFKEDVLLGYNLHFLNSSEEFDLGGLNLLSNDHPHSIVYHHLNYPTFVITRNKEKKLFGSCRKLHGKGEDALASGDLKLHETYFNPQERPGALFLTGDQIYADDVAGPITPFIHHLAEELVGFEEDLSAVDERLKLKHFRRALRQINGRQFIMEKFCKFTSRNAHNHMMTFGEYSSMYLLSYSPELWILANEKQMIRSFDDVVNSEDFYFVYPNKQGYEDEFSREFIEQKSNYQEQLEELQQFQQTLPQVRRLLANIPTYMIFDDHDITDDWNLSLEWKENVENSNLGKHVIANGLAAYWAFQGWGNNPEQYENSFLIKMQKYLQSFNVHSSAYQTWSETLYTFDQWSFVAPTTPMSLFLDTRTKRSFDILPKPKQAGNVVKEITTGPQLISSKGWEILSKQLKKSGWSSGSPLIMVSPAPFYGIRLIEAFLFEYVLPLKLFRLPVQSAFDLEAWRFNGRGYHEFHHMISKWNPSSCIILSGDAHMASAVETEVTFSHGERRNLQQFTASPMKNDSFSTLVELFLKGLLRLYKLTNGKNEIHRSCDSSFNLNYEKETDPARKSCLWRENIQYLSLPNGSIVETNNNLGLLDDDCVFLLQFKDSHLEERAYE